ncbi:MAG: transcription-repair coupling factor [Bacillota bacterium]
MKLNNVFLQSEKTQNLLKLLKQNKNIKVSGLTNSRMAFFTGNICKKINNQIILITFDSYRVDQIYEDLIRVIDSNKIYTFPHHEILPHEEIMPDYLTSKARIEAMEECIYGKNDFNIIITTGEALLRKLMPASVFKQYSVFLETGKKIKFNKVIDNISLLGYERVKKIEEPQQFSVRGGILDIFPLTADKPLRIELFGDEIDSIRLFELNSQRSFENIKKIIIPPAREIMIIPQKVNDKIPVIKRDYEQGQKRLRSLDDSSAADYLKEKEEENLEKLKEFNIFPGYEQFLPYFYNKLDTFFDYINSDAYLFIDQYKRVQNKVENSIKEIQENHTSLLEQGSVLSSYIDNFMQLSEFKSNIIDYRGLYFTEEFYNIPLNINLEEIIFNTGGVEPYHGQLELLTTRIKELIENNYTIVITLDTAGKIERIAEYFSEEDLSVSYSGDNIVKNQINFVEGSFSEGFIIEDTRLVVYTEKEVIGKPQRKKRKISDLDEGTSISSLNELNPGDFVVHENHGIGKYLGIETLKVQEQHQDYLVLRYADGDKLYVPTEQVDLVQKYVGADGKPPKLYNLGGSEWQKVKQRVKNSVKEMAIELLELYAERETVEGYSFSSDTVWQKEFEEKFPYEETPDQLRAIEEVKNDMEQSQPMDRLLCGDVGYGKTEVAIRAAFKAAVDEKQTAVLVPTTILAQQHYNTFKERIGEYPINVEMVSRFKTNKEQRIILEKLTRGEVDIVVGTHRLLSNDVVFNDLGLLIIDEEQRFGVSHKEKIKDYKRSVDVLTMTATPIPRTLHMALAGVRDMSVIETPPENRFPIRTYIREFNKELIREAIRRELGRNGQIYFVHNRVQDIEKKADIIRELVPEARTAIAHGQMSENRLEKLMHSFYNQKYDILVCTTIIESGLDIPNVNTIIINRAEQMGLAQLYQLRGRVGRSNRIAYAYLLYKKDKILSEVAEKRLKAIKEFTNLGSGFKIAMRDLEIRGAGNLLGPEQHGHIASIGFSLYCKLLENAVQELKGKKEEEKEIEIDLELDAYIPEDYISDSEQKIEIYKKIKNVKTEEQVRDLIDELIDRFGDPPEVVMNLIEISRINVKSKSLGIKKINQEERMVNVHFRSMEEIDGEAIMELVNKYSGKIKIKSGNNPVIGIKTGKDNPLNFILKIIRELTVLVEV